MSFDKPRLPAELWKSIFRAYCSPQELEIVLSSNCGPWLLSQVSHHWRAIALSTPSLWSCLYIRPEVFIEDAKRRRDCRGYRNSKFSTESDSEDDGNDAIPPYHPDIYRKAVLARLETVLLRSMPLPLSIQVTVGASKNQEPILLPLYRLLITHCDRWQDMYLTKVTESFRTVFMEQYAIWPPSRQFQPFPHLRSIRFRDLSSATFDFFAYPTPQLTSITCLHAHNSKISELFPESRITQCSLWYARASSAVPMLDRIRSTVEDLTLVKDFNQDEDAPNQEWAMTAEFPRMRKLSCHEADGYFSSLYARILAPALEALDTSFKSRRNIIILINMCSRSNLTGVLNRLRLKHVYASDSDQLASLLRILPSLENLDISFAYSGRQPSIADAATELVSLLKLHTNDLDGMVKPDVCPRLKDLSICPETGYDMDEIRLGVVADMVEVRRGAKLASGCLHLQSFSMRVVDAWKKRDPALDRLRVLRAKGLAIDFWNHRPVGVQW